MSFLPFLGGLAKGVSETYNQNSEEDRKNKQANNKLVADSIQKRLENDDTLLPDEQTHLLGEFLDLHGVDKKTKEHIINTSSYMRNSIGEQKRKAATDQTRATAPADLSDGQAPPSANPGLGDLPTLGGGTSQTASSMAPPVPAFSPQSSGDLALPQQIRHATAIAKATATAASDSKLELMDAEDEYKFKKADEIQGRVAKGELTQEQADQRFQVLGIKPKTGAAGGGTATYLPQAMSGTDLKSRMKAEGKPQADIDAIEDTGLYRVSLDPSKTKVAGTFKVLSNTYQGKTAIGSNFIGQFPKDKLGNDTDPNAVYYPVLDRTGGTINGIVPETLINTSSVRNNFKTVRQANGDEALVPVTETTENTKTPAGTTGAPGPVTNTPANSVTPASPLPSAPPALGTPPPQVVPGARGRARVNGPGTVVGGTPMTPEQKLKSGQQAEQLNNTIGIIKDLKSQIPVLSSLISTGKIALQVDPEQHFYKAIINRNVPMSEAEKNLAANWQLLTESVLQMRIPMGGAGFRGPEGFGAIESNKGILTQNPDIMRRVLDGTLREFKAQRDPLVKAGGKYGYDVQPEMEHGPAPTTSYAHYATGANGHKIGSNDGVKWFDSVTGTPVN